MPNSHSFIPAGRRSDMTKWKLEGVGVVADDSAPAASSTAPVADEAVAPAPVVDEAPAPVKAKRKTAKKKTEPTE